MSVYRYGVGIIVLMIFLQCFFPAAASENVLETHEKLKQREQEIVAELIQTELLLDRTNREYHQVLTTLNQTRAQLPAMQEKLALSQEQLNTSRQKLSLWLRHFYMEGQTGYLYILLGAVDLRDFINRVALVGILVSQGIKNYYDTMAAFDEVKQRTTELGKLEQTLVDQQKFLANKKEQIAQLQQSKQNLLTRTRQELGESQGRVLLVVERLHSVLLPMDTLLARFEHAPWEEYRPDQIHWLGSKVKVVYKDSTLTRLLFSGVEQRYAARASFAKQQLVIQGQGEDNIPFTIAGQLQVSGENVRYNIQSIKIGEYTLDADLVRMVGGDDGIVYPLGKIMGWRLQHIQIDEGKATLELVPT
ncbi:hypothetical protein B0537_03325 [Desulforamulus ferrireducens]|uniref:Uncharacterized protein n=2 Tax=Desulforamulus ferrireducens TaxID=1833852 RepID=A0A1S6J0D8_9FIRM|nr:hypothetical protein B0537_03325 [Desulforamulus ferrireducens]